MTNETRDYTHLVRLTYAQVFGASDIPGLEWDKRGYIPLEVSIDVLRQAAENHGFEIDGIFGVEKIMGIFIVHKKENPGPDSNLELFNQLDPENPETLWIKNDDFGKFKEIFFGEKQDEASS